MSSYPSAAAKNPEPKHSSESILYGVNFMPILTATGETLTGTPTATLQTITPPANTSPALTIAAPQIHVATCVDDDGNTVAVGMGVQVRVAAGVSPTDYQIAVTCATTAGNTRTVVCTVRVRDT